MRNLLNKPWFVAAMAGVALLIVGRSFLTGQNAPILPGFPSASAEVADATSTEAPAEDAAHLPVAAALRALVIPAAHRDPFVRAVVVVDEGTKVKKVEPDFVDTVHVSALWTQDGQTIILINDRICHQGDELGRLKIESATQDGVWVSHWKGHDFVSLGGNFTLTTPAAPDNKPVGFSSL